LQGGGRSEGGSEAAAGCSEASFELHVGRLHVRQGALVVVCGVLGSGKTSLLEALLGEMVPVEGGVRHVFGACAYASQVPWIVNATLRDNVLFGRAFDERRYQQVLRRCNRSRIGHGG
jgi:ABC-type transport system involved in cytochrome bd biosynthesis fused ATPase/permease subunit